jgi:hypothetical protein
MDWTLDKDCNPVWLCKLAGVLSPAFMLVVGAVAAVVHRGQSGTDWAVIGWCLSIFISFWLRYRSGKVASLAWEFSFGALLTNGVLTLFALAHRSWWSMEVFFGFCIVPIVAIKYVRHFYFSSSQTSQQPGIQGKR